MWHTGVMVVPIECDINAVVGNLARQVPTICNDIGQALDDVSHAHGKSKSTKKILGRKNERGHMSKQGVSSPHSYADIMKLCCGKKLQLST
jgi:hypothetical protein